MQIKGNIQQDSFIPICGQKLTDINYVNGVVILRVKCRRCKNYINVDIIGFQK